MGFTGYMGEGERHGAVSRCSGGDMCRWTYFDYRVADLWEETEDLEWPAWFQDKLERTLEDIYCKVSRPESVL